MSAVDAAGRQLTAGVLGHVDHGKTALVGALTGMQTDRLAEERERGLSIVLGYAWLGFEEGNVDLIDVPGHESFIRTMVAGATGIDAALLVVDAAEGVKPQTREHMAIAALLGVERGICVLSKVDRLAPAAREQAMAALRGYTAGTFLAAAPHLAVSAATGEGMAALREALHGELAASAPPAAGAGPFHMPLDRAFSLRGHGTIVTGTVRAGTLRRDDALVLMPAGRRVQIRALQCHGAEVPQAWRGQRLAVNLRGVEQEEVRRGDCLATDGALVVTDRADAELQVLADAPLLPRHGRHLRVLAGTSEHMARLRVLDRDQLAPGASALVQLRFDAPVALADRERFVVRTESPVHTFGGGCVLERRPGAHRRRDPAAIAHLQALASADPSVRWRAMLAAAGEAGIDLAEASLPLRPGDADWPALLEALDAVCLQERVLIGRPALEAMRERIAASLAAFHREEPARRGIQPAALARRCEMDGEGTVFAYLLQDLRVKGAVKIEDALVREATHDPFAALPAAERARLEALEQGIRDAWLQPPEAGEVLARGKADRRLLELLLEHGRVVLITAEDGERKLVWHEAAVAYAERLLRRQFPPPAGFTVSQARKTLGSTRKYVLPLLAHLDARGRTRRRGDQRRFTSL